MVNKFATQVVFVSSTLRGIVANYSIYSAFIVEATLLA